MAGFTTYTGCKCAGMNIASYVSSFKLIAAQQTGETDLYSKLNVSTEKTAMYQNNLAIQGPSING